VFGLELEGLSEEDRELEVARAFVRFADRAGDACDTDLPELCEVDLLDEAPPQPGDARAVRIALAILQLDLYGDVLGVLPAVKTLTERWRSGKLRFTSDDLNRRLYHQWRRGERLDPAARRDLYARIRSTGPQAFTGLATWLAQLDSRHLVGKALPRPVVVMPGRYCWPASVRKPGAGR
jgi:hypothetical protein